MPKGLYYTAVFFSERELTFTGEDLLVVKLVVITNRKSYMSFRLIPKSATLNDLLVLEW